MPKKSGFTLIELLVVITIIGILSVVGMTIYSGVQKRAQDTKKKADIDAIATAYELNYNRKEQRYKKLTGGEFQGGQVPDGSNYCGLLMADASSFTICTQLGNNKHCRESIRGTPPAPCQPTPGPAEGGRRDSPCPPYGDVDGDGKISEDDATMITQSVVGGFTPLTCPQQQAADVDADGSISNSDATRVYRYVEGKLDTFDVCSKRSKISC